MEDEIKFIKSASTAIGEFLHMRDTAMARQYGWAAPEPHHEPVGDWEVERKDERGEVTALLLTQGHYGCIGPMPEKLTEAIAWLQRYLDAVPVELQPTAKFEIESEGGYEDEHHVELTISYRRPETDEEWAARKADVEARLAIDNAKREAADLATFKRLKAKFG